MAKHYLACDLGAESGRVMLGTLEENRIALQELHRFSNVPIKADGGLHWDLPALVEQLKTGLKKAAALRMPIASISTDSWGVDYMLVDEAGAIIPPTFHYRDPRSARGIERMHRLVPWEQIFAETGIQFMSLNTLYQLATEPAERLHSAEKLLTIADGFNFILSGAAAIEESNASTTQFYNPRTRDWSWTLLDALQVPRNLLPPIVRSGTRLRRLKPEIARETGLPEIEVVAGCSHDTGAAVAAVPASGQGWAYLSSGTWSLIGVERAEPLLTAPCRDLNFTNEIGFGGSVRLLKNIVGLWLVQECRREWARQGADYDYPALTRLAAAAPPFVSLINVADPRFVPPDEMPQRIAAFCRETGQPIPASAGATIRCILESLALLYRRTIHSIEELVGHKIERLHIVGGGSRNELLNQFAANAMQVPILAGPVEATALGNVLIQAIAHGDLPSLAAAREVVRNSFTPMEYTPADAAPWNEALERFEKLTAA